MVPEGYETDETDVRFTRGELDMVYFALLKATDHPVAAQYAIKKEGIETLQSVIHKIEALDESGEPDVYSAEPKDAWHT